MLFLILFLHQTTTYRVANSCANCCFLFCFYIKPQRCAILVHNLKSCFLFCFYIKPQQLIRALYILLSCFLFCFYIKPQLIHLIHLNTLVVSYSVSTSNHNRSSYMYFVTLVVSYSVSTSNHNTGYLMRLFPVSYVVFTINKMDYELPAKCV